MSGICSSALDPVGRTDGDDPRSGSRRGVGAIAGSVSGRCLPTKVTVPCLPLILCNAQPGTGGRAEGEGEHEQFDPECDLRLLRRRAGGAILERGHPVVSFETTDAGQHLLGLSGAPNGVGPRLVFVNVSEPKTAAAVVGRATWLGAT